METDTPSAERKRLFGLLSIENAIQLAIILSAIVAGYAYQSADIRYLMRESLTHESKIDSIDKTQNQQAAQIQTNMTINTEQSAAISALQQGRDADRKLLTDIAVSVGILLDRTDPQKHSQK